MKTLLPFFKKATALFLVMLFMAVVQKSFGQAASATWTLTSSTTPSTSGNLTATAPTFGSGLTATGSNDGTYGLHAKSWGGGTLTVSSSTDYFQFTVSPSGANSLDITSLVLNYRNNESNMPDGMAIYYSTSASFSSPVAIVNSSTNVTATSGSYSNSSLGIVAASGTTLYFRVYFYNVSGNNVEFGATSLTLSGSTFGAASKLVYTVQPSNTASGTAISPSVAVAVEDASGNIVLNDTRNITLAIATNPSGGALSGTTTVAASNGVATFSGISIDKIGTGYTLKATGTLTVTSNAFNISVGAASKLVFGVEPTNATAGASMTPAVTVQVQDAGGNVITGDTRNITLAIGTNPGGGTLAGTVTVAAVGGIATFSNLSINKSGTGYTLAATSSPTLTGATSASFNITSGSASQLVFSTQPSNTVAGSSITPSVVVQVQDANGNVVTSDTRSITISIGTNAGGGTLSGTATVSAVSGAATFSGLSINKTGTGYTFSATGGSFTIVSSAFNITPGAASKLVFSTQPSNTVSATAISPAVVVQVQDANSNIVTSDNRTIVMSISNNAGGGTLSGTLSVAAVNGVATFSNLSIDKAGTGYTLKATATLTVTSSAFNITPGAAAKLGFNVQPSNAVAGATISPAIKVQIQDASGNLITTDNSTSITLAIGTNPGGGTLSGTATIVASAGVATFSTLWIDKTGTGYTLNTTSSPALTTATSSAFNITPGALASMTMSTIGSPQPVDSTFTSSVTITGRDAYGNLVNSGSANFSTTAGSVTPITGTFSSSGTIVVNNFKVTQSGNGKTITATSGSIFVTSNAFDVSTFNSSASGDYFKSNASADWATVSTWQGSHDGTNWYAATAYPTSAATSIAVQNIHNITISNAVSSSALAISGTVTVTGTGNLTSTGATTSTASTLAINAGGIYTHNQDGGSIPTATWDPASTCLVSGVSSTAPSGLSQAFGHFTWSSNLSSSINLNSALKTINGNFTVSSTSGSALTLANNSALTMTIGGSFIYSAASSLVLTSGSSNPQITINGGMSLSGGGSLDFGSGNGSATINLKGNFSESNGTDRMQSGTGANGVINFVGTAQSITSSGSGSNASNVDFNISSGDVVTLNSNFAINNNNQVFFISGTLTVNGTLICGTNTITGVSKSTGIFSFNTNSTLVVSTGGTIQLGSPYGITASGTGSTSGNVQAATRTFNAGGNYVYNGTAAQATGNGLPAAISGSLTINNNAGVTLSQATNLSGTLNLTAGLLTTTATNLLSMAAASSYNLVASDYTNTSYVNGPLQRTGTTAFTFPVGKSGTGYVPITISGTSNSSSQTFRAEYIHSSASALGPIASGSRLQRVSSCDYWNLNLYNSSGTQISSLPSGATVNLTLYWNQNSACNAITDLSSLAVGHFGSANTWDEAVIGGAYNPPTGDGTNGSITAVGVANFSPFALATTNGISNPLPITLDYFTATKQVGHNKLTWKVECTSSSSSFDVERSYDGVSFEAINTVKVTSATDCASPFVYNDYSSNGSTIYYRIKMVDIDDNAKYSNIEIISNNSNAIELMSIQPNPVYGDANLKVAASSTQNIELAILSIDGKQIQHKALQVQQGTNMVQLNTSGLTKGVYFVKGIFENGQTNIIKFIKQ